MTTKFNQELYAKMKAKKNNLLSSLGKKVVLIFDKGTSITPTTSIPKAMKTASPTTLLEEITPHPKRQKTTVKGKEKVGSQTSSVWDDAGLALAQALNAVTTEDLKVLSSVPSHEVVNRHITSSSR